MDPLTIMGIGAAVGGIGGFLGQSSANSQAEAAADRANEYQEAVYEFQYGPIGKDKIGGELKRQYEFAVEGLEITKRNNEANLQFQEAQILQQYDYQMGIRAYEFTQANRVYEQSANRAIRQQSFNQLATQAAITDQRRYLHEQLIGIALNETESLYKYGAAAAGVGLKKRQSKAAAVLEAQKDRIAAAKATGTAQARGVSGRSAASVVQGALAESGARQSAIVEQFLFNTEATDQDLLKLNQQFLIDQVGFEFSRDSAQLSNISTLNKIRAQALQGAISAANSIALKPEIAPPLPTPMALPRPEYQDVYKPKKPPEPMEQVAMTQNPFLSGLSGAISGAQAGLSIGTALPSAGGGGGFQYGSTGIGAGGGKVGGVGTYGPNYGISQ